MILKKKMPFYDPGIKIPFIKFTVVSVQNCIFYWPIACLLSSRTMYDLTVVLYGSSN